MIKKNSITHFLLLALEKSIKIEVNLVDYAYNSHKLLYGYPRKINYGSLYQAIKDLQEKGFIETEKNEGKIMLKLTDTGYSQALLQQILANEKWDGKWRVVVFDIPEKHRKLRNALRSKLREWEFISWQKSVWASKKAVEKQLKVFLKEIGLEEWVKVLVCTDS